MYHESWQADFIRELTHRQARLILLPNTWDNKSNTLCHVPLMIHIWCMVTGNCVWRKISKRCVSWMRDFKTLRQNHASDIIFYNHASDMQYKSGYIDIRVLATVITKQRGMVLSWFISIFKVDEPCKNENASALTRPQSHDMPSLSVFLPQSCQVTSGRHTATSCDLCHDKMNLLNLHLKKPENHSRFCDPDLLTYDLDLPTHPRYYQGQSSHWILGSYLKRFGRESTE